MSALVELYVRKFIADQEQKGYALLEDGGPSLTDEVDDALAACVLSFSDGDLFAILWTLTAIDGDALPGDLTDNSVRAMLESIVEAAFKEEILRVSGFFERRQQAMMAARSRRGS